MTADDTAPAAPALSVLDLSMLSRGTTSAEALEETTTLARRADALGYRRFWVAEHHAMPAIASTSPAVLIAHLAARTERIRVGSGGVMVPNHAPLVVAEQFAMLEALHPGRIDLGIGRAPGTDPRTASALRRSTDIGAETFPRDLLDILGLLGDERGADGLAHYFRATPVPAAHGAGSAPPVWLLGSSGFSAQLSAQLGLPFAFAHHFSGENTDAAIALHRSSFQPSAALSSPHVLVSSSVLVADSREEAEHLAGPMRLMGLRMRRGAPIEPLSTPDDAAVALADLDEVERSLLPHVPGVQLTGTVDDVVAGLRELVARTGADELMLTVPAADLDSRLRTLDRIAGAWPVG